MRVFWILTTLAVLFYLGMLAGELTALAASPASSSAGQSNGEVSGNEESGAYPPVEEKPPIQPRLHVSGPNDLTKDSQNQGKASSSTNTTTGKP